MVKILKFGGSSLATPEHIQSVVAIILNAAQSSNIIVVVSAFQGITNSLLTCARQAATHHKEYVNLYQTIAERHREAIQVVEKSSVLIDPLLEELRSTLEGIYLLHECSKHSLDSIASFGERLSAQIVACYVQQKQPAIAIDARHFIITDDQYTRANLLLSETCQAVQDYFNKHALSAIPIVTGFIGKTKDGDTTTIGRNGSDYSAAIIGSCLDADAIEIWTDVDGIYTADPSIVEKAYIIPQISYEEAMELSHFGAKVLHSATIGPAVAKHIPIYIKNTFHPHAPGTLINQNIDKNDRGVKGITSIDNVTLMMLKGVDRVGVSEAAERLFHALAKHRINIILISQASSEHTLCFAISDMDLITAEKEITQEFQHEISNHLVMLEKKSGQTIIAVVGANMIGTPGIAGKLFYTLGNNKININAIAQGASELNISFAIHSAQAKLAVNAVHQCFFEEHKQLALCFLGIGNVGAALLSLIEQQAGVLYEKGYDLKVCAIANSKKLSFDAQGIDLQHWQTNFHYAEDVPNLNDILDRLNKANLTHVALIDCTASTHVVSHYKDFIESNMHIVTPNKHAHVLPWKKYHELIQLIEEKKCHFLFEATVGAGLPIISTLQDLIMGGDIIVSIEGIFSGTLSYIFNQYDGCMPFSEIIQQAHQQGYTEPDPREDLSGNDVARKLLILARLLGRKMDFEDITIENLVPPPLRKGQFTKEFYSQLDDCNAEILNRLQKAENNHCVLRYIGILDERGARAELREIPKSHPLALAKQNDNSIAFTTQRYNVSPLVIQGPGAGASVTAMGVFSDIVKLLHYLPY